MPHRLWRDVCRCTKGLRVFFFLFFHSLSLGATGVIAFVRAGRLYSLRGILPSHVRKPRVSLYAQRLVACSDVVCAARDPSFVLATNAASSLPRPSSFGHRHHSTFSAASRRPYSARDECLAFQRGTRTDFRIVADKEREINKTGYRGSPCGNSRMPPEGGRPAAVLRHAAPRTCYRGLRLMT